MTLTPEQKQTISSWVAAGDNLSAVQKKLSEQFKISMTYRDVRFLVDDLNLELKDPAPKADASDVTKAPPAPVGGPAAAGSPRGAPAAAEPVDPNAPLDEEVLDEATPNDLPVPPAGLGSLTLDIDRVVRPGAAMSGSVTFSDGVSGKWALDQYGRLMLDTGKPGYQPSPADVQVFQRELQTQLQRQGY